MLFNSLSFLAFFPAVCLVYWLLPSSGRWRTVFLLAASYYFYLCWEPVYLLLIAGVTILSWACGLGMERTRMPRTWLAAGLTLSFGLLFLYKYLDFFGTELSRLMHACGLAVDIPSFGLLLPVGISFYTFQVAGYMVDVYRKEIPAERSLLTYALFVAFFPQLVAGPIEQAGHLLPQFHRPHRFSGRAMASGLRLMMWGYFMKLCVADNVSPYVDAVFGNAAFHSGTSCLLAAFFYSFQIFCDFGGYSLIAIGAARCMGFSLIHNFRQPYLSTSVADFWRRWHVSLNGWFVRYVYIPLGGSRKGPLRHAANVMTVCVVSGLWHGAGWTFLLWGAVNGALVALHTHWRKAAAGLPRVMPAWLSTTLSVMLTFAVVTLTWTIFRARDLGELATLYSRMLTDAGPLYRGDGLKALAVCLAMIAVLMVREIRLWLAGREEEETESPVRTALVTASLIVVILLFGNFNARSFIYFQF